MLLMFKSKKIKLKILLEMMCVLIFTKYGRNNEQSLPYLLELMNEMDGG